MKAIKSLWYIISRTLCQVKINRITVILSLLLLFFNPVFCPAENFNDNQASPLLLPGGQSVLQSEWSENKYFRNRLWVKFPQYSLTCLGLSIDTLAGPVYRMAGLETPFLCLGPVTMEGLLKEINNPLGYQATSIIFRQVPKLKLNGAFQHKERLGLVIGPFSLLPAPFLLTQKTSQLDRLPAIEAWGFFAPWELSEAVSLELLWAQAQGVCGEAAAKRQGAGTPAGSPANQAALVNPSCPFAQVDQVDQFDQFEQSNPATPASPASQTDSLTIWAFRSRFKEIWQSGALSAMATMALTNGQTEQPGFFDTLQASLQTPWLEADGLWGAASPAYRNFAGEKPVLWQRAELHLDIPFLTFYRIGAGYTRQIAFPDRENGHKSGCFFPTKEDFSFKASANLPLALFAHRPDTRLSLSAACRERDTYAGDGALAKSLQLTAISALKLPSCSFSLTYQYTEQATGAAEHKGKLFAGWSRSPCELSLELEQAYAASKSVTPPGITLSADWEQVYSAQGRFAGTGTSAAKSEAASTRQAGSKNRCRFYGKLKHEYKSNRSEPAPGAVRLYKAETGEGWLYITLGWEMHWQ